jgi:hypothetical protein
MGISRLIATALLVLTIAMSVTSSTTAYGHVLTIQPEPTPILQEEQAVIKDLSISFANRTNATLVNEPITEEQGNTIVAAINAILLDNEDLEDLELLEEPIEEEELEEIEESDDSDNGNEDDNNGSDESELDQEEPKCHTDQRIYNEELGSCIPAHVDVCPAVVTFGDGPCDEYPAPECPEGYEAGYYSGECEPEPIDDAP